MIKAFIFDLDGTPLDTIGDIAAAHNHILREFGFPEREFADFGAIIGGGIMEAIKRAAPEGTPHGTLVKLNELYQSYYPERCTDLTAPYGGMAETVRELAASSVLLGVYTNKTEPTAIKMVKHFFPDAKFEFIWGNDGIRPLKPAPDAGFAAKCAFGLKNNEIAYVGDSDVDMVFARAAGFYAVGACWGYRGREELSRAGADFLAENPADLLKLL
jgi:phosphoglycolate phosphatase